MKVFQITYPGWNQFPVYLCNNKNDWDEISSWMDKNGCDSFLLSSGGFGYVFQVRKNYEWFVLRWS